MPIIAAVNSLPSQTGQAGKFVTTNGTVASWATVTVPVAANPSVSIGLTAVNGSAATFMRSDGAPALDVTIAPTWTGTHTFQKNGIATTSTDGVVLANTTSATMGTPLQYSPRVRFSCNAYVPGSTQNEFIVELKPTTAYGTLVFSSRIGGSGSFTQNMLLTSDGNLTLTPGVTTGTGATSPPSAGISVAMNSLTSGNGLDISSTSLTTGNLVNLSAPAGKIALSISSSYGTTGLYAAQFGGLGVDSIRATGSIFPTYQIDFSNHDIGVNSGATGNPSAFGVRSSGFYGWTNNTSWQSPYDTALARNAAGVVEIDNGTAGQWASLKLGVNDSATATVTNGLTIGHQTSNKATMAAGFGSALLFNADDTTSSDQACAQIAASWTTATHSGPVSQLAFNLINGTAGTLATMVTLQANFLALGPATSSYFAIGIDPQQSAYMACLLGDKSNYAYLGLRGFSIYQNTSNARSGLLEDDGSGAYLALGSAGVLKFNSASTFASGSIDSGLSRVSANVLGVGNGTAGDYSGTLKLTGININPGSSGAASGVGTLTNAPASGNAQYWIPITVNGTAYWIPAWHA